MSTDEILELELSLLFIKYGERKVFRSLARVNSLDRSELQTKLKKTHQLHKKPAIKQDKNPSKAIEQIIIQHPEKSNLLGVLYSRFLSRSFLPELRDIKRLFNRHAWDSKSLKSRNTSATKIFKLLATLDEKELGELAQEEDRRTYSSLGIISAEIMRRS